MLSRTQISFGLLSLATLPSISDAQELGTGVNPEVSVVRILLAVVFCAFVAFVAVAWLKQRGGGSLKLDLARLLSPTPDDADKQIHILDSRRAGTNIDTVAISYKEREYLILSSPSGLQVIDQWPKGKKADGQVDGDLT